MTLAQEKRKRAWLQGTLAIDHEDGGGSGAGSVADQWITQKAAQSAPVEAHHITKYVARPFLALLAPYHPPTDEMIDVRDCRAEISAAERAAQQKAIVRAKQLTQAHARAQVALKHAERLAAASSAAASAGAPQLERLDRSN